VCSVTYVTTASVEGDGHGTRRPPLITAGVALVGAGVVIVTPVLSPLLAGTLPPSVDITSRDLVLGGLLSPGSSLLNGISATISGLPVSLTGHAVGPIGSSIELDQAIATALGFSFPTPAMDTVRPLGDLLSTLTTALDGDLPTALPVFPATSAPC
jgi:hypothetical protein